MSGCGSLLVSRSSLSYVLKQLSYVRTPSLSLLKWLPRTKDTKIVSFFYLFCLLSDLLFIELTNQLYAAERQIFVIHQQ